MKLFGSFVLLLALIVVRGAIAAGTWTSLSQSAPGSVSLMLLLPDGTVMAAEAGTGKRWFKLTPDALGSYVNGTWTTLASMQDTRLYYSSAVLRDGRVFVAGGEYGSGGAKAEIYDPLADTWTQINPPASLLDPTRMSPISTSQNQAFVDSPCKILPNGNVLVAPVFPSVTGGTLIYNPAANTWYAGPTLSGVTDQDEASWVKLPDDSILTVDPFGTNSERYISSLGPVGTWITDTNVPVSLYDTNAELGAAFLLPDGRAFFLGGVSQTALYTPTGNTNVGTWAAGAIIPGGLGAPDAPAAMMVNGNILCAFGPLTYLGSDGKPVFPKPTSFYEYNYVANSFVPVSGPTGPTDDIEPYKTIMLDLPDGTVLYSHSSSQLYVYRPTGAPLAAGKPAITRISLNLDASWHLTGTGLNGISAGAAYGDDAQMDSNYPLVRLSDASGNVSYARTFNWSSTGVMTGNKPVTTEFFLNPSLFPGWYSLAAVANGISSDPVSFYGPVWVDFNAFVPLMFGTYIFPYHTAAQGTGAVDPGGTIVFKGPASSKETMTIAKAMTLRAVGGAVTIGR